MFILEMFGSNKIVGVGSDQGVQKPAPPESIFQSLVLGNQNPPKPAKSAKPKIKRVRGNSGATKTFKVKESISPAAKRIRRIKRITKLLIKTAKGERGSFDQAKLKTALYNLLKSETGKDITEKKKADIDQFLNDMGSDKPAMDINKDEKFDHNDVIALWEDEP